MNTVNPSTPAKKQPKIAYVTGIYPAMSLTFIEREIQALRRLNFDITTVSIREPESSHGLGTDTDFGREEIAERSTTHYLLKELRSPAALLATAAFALTRPLRCLSTFAFALRRAPNGVKAMLLQIAYFFEAVALARFVKLQHIDHIHNHFAGASTTVTLLTAKLVDVPFSFTLHGPTDLMEPVAQQLGAKVATAQFVSCISYFARSQCFLYSEPDHWKKLKIIHCGVNVDRYAPVERDDDQIRMLFVGRLSHVKGLPILFEALKHLNQNLPNLTLCIVGEGPERARLEALAADVDIDVTFMGFQTQDQVVQEMATCDFLVLPSFAEGVPVVLMEAMASGKPVIATRIAGVHELVDHGQSGLLVHPGDAHGLADAIAQLCHDPQLRERMGSVGRAKVEAEFDIDGEAARLAALFHGETDNTR